MTIDHPVRPVFSPSEKMFACNLKLKGKKYPSITRHFNNRFRRGPPTRQGINKMVRNLNTKYTTLDCRKGRSGRPVSVRTVQNIAAVRRSLERAASRKSGQPGPSSRRHNELISKTSYNRITKKDLKLKPYKILCKSSLSSDQLNCQNKIIRYILNS